MGLAVLVDCKGPTTLRGFFRWLSDLIGRALLPRRAIARLSSNLEGAAFEETWARMGFDLLGP